MKAQSLLLWGSRAPRGPAFRRASGFRNYAGLLGSPEDLVLSRGLQVRKRAWEGLRDCGFSRVSGSVATESEGLGLGLVLQIRAPFQGPSYERAVPKKGPNLENYPIWGYGHCDMESAVSGVGM